MEYIDASNDPKAFFEAVKGNKKVFVDFVTNDTLEWDGEKLLYTYPHRGEYLTSHFPGLFKSTDEDMSHVFAFWRELKKLNGE